MNRDAYGHRREPGVQGVVGPGTVLGGRYALRNRLSLDGELERWSAHDATLLREVMLTVVGSDHRNSAAVLDAARRAAGVEDTRLVRILDVGTQDGVAFIVEETMSGSVSLTTILLQGPLPAEEARRVAGETATALETAGRRGLHHLRLAPHHIMIAPDGVIRLSGVAVAGAIEGPDEQELDAVTASRRDAVCLVAVVYAALTSRWPLDEPVPGLEPAPRVSDGVVAPSEIATGVPGDLDALCRMTLNQASGPLTPGDFAHRIAPWPREQVARAGVDPTEVLHLPRSGGTLGTAGANLDDDPEPSDSAAAVAAGTHPTVAISTNTPSPSPPAQPPDPGRHPAGPRPATVRQPGRTAAVGSSSAKGRASTALTGAGAVAGVVSGKLSSLARAAAPQGARTSADRKGEQTMPLGLQDQPADVEKPLPLLPASTALAPSRGQAKIVVVLVLLFVAFAMFMGFRGLLSPGSGSSLGIHTPKKTRAVKAPVIRAPATPAPDTGKTAAAPIAILSATGFDPEGDQHERNSQAARVYDGDLSTSWSSEMYATARFGNLKEGLGVVVDLGQPTSVHQVTIDLGKGPVDVTAYAATDSSLTGATVIGEATGADGQVQLRAAGAMPEAQYVIIWFTKLARDGGSFRASVSEIALS